MSLVAQLVKTLSAVQGTWVRSLGWEDPLEKGTGYPLQYSGLEKSMDGTVHGVAESPARLSDFHFPWIWMLIIDQTKDTFQKFRTMEQDVY